MPGGTSYGMDKKDVGYQMWNLYLMNQDFKINMRKIELITYGTLSNKYN